MLDTLAIRALETQYEAETCARMMAESDPWITLRLDYQTLLDSVLHPDKEVYVSTADDEVIGFVVINMHGACVGYVPSLCVAAGHRGNGIGRQLIAFAEDRIYRDSPHVFITVSSFNDRAQRFYASLGYEVVGEFPDHNVKGHSEFLVRKSLGSFHEFRQSR